MLPTALRAVDGPVHLVERTPHKRPATAVEHGHDPKTVEMRARTTPVARVVEPHSVHASSVFDCDVYALYLRAVGAPGPDSPVVAAKLDSS